MKPNMKSHDHGYLYFKSFGLNEPPRIIKSAYTTSNSAFDGTEHITIDGTDIYVGIGKTTSNPDKIDEGINKVMSLTDLAMSGIEETFLVASLPIGQFYEQRDRLMKSIFDYNNSEVIYNNKPMKIKIKDVTIYPQGAGALYSMDKMDGEFIILDIGGLTICVAYIEMINGSPRIVKYDTWFKGVSTQHSKIIEEVNNRYNLTLQPSYADKILINGLKVNGETKDISFINNIFTDYLDDILQYFELNYPSKTTDIYLCGGGAIILEDMLRRRFGNNVFMIPNSQFANAYGFFRIGIQKYYKYIV